MLCFKLVSVINVCVWSSKLFLENIGDGFLIRIFVVLRLIKVLIFPQVPCGTEIDQKPPRCPKPCPIIPLCRHAPNCKVCFYVFAVFGLYFE